MVVMMARSRAEGHRSTARSSIRCDHHVIAMLVRCIEQGTIR